MAEQQFYTLITNVGQAKLANATALGTKVNFAKLQVGDGKDYNPNETQENLKHKVWEGSINSITTDSKNPNWIVIQTLIPASVGGFNINEVGVFDDEGNMLIVSKYPETYKPKLENGSGKDLTIKLVIQVSNTESVTLKIDPSITIATKEDIRSVEKQIGNIKVPVQSVNNKIGAIELKATDIKTADGTNLEEFKKKINSQYEESVKKTDKRVQDFINTKNKANGIAGLDEHGKIKKEYLNNVVKVAHGVWNDLVTKINNGRTYTKKIALGFDADLINIFLKNKKFNTKVAKNDYYGSVNDQTYLITINFKTNITTIIYMEANTTASSHTWRGFNFNDYPEFAIETSSHNYYTGSSWVYNKCLLKKILIEQGELKIVFENEGRYSDKDVCLNIENLAWSAYKFS